MKALPWISCLLTTAVTAQVQFRELGRLDHMVADHYATKALALADIDGNRTLDLVVLHDFGISFWLGNGQGAFVERVENRIALPLGSVAGLAITDFDGDGDNDIAYFKWIVNRDTSAKLLLNDGHGRFVDASSRLPATQRVSSLAVADVDGDGDTDLFVGGGNAGSAGRGATNRLFRNDGKANFTEFAGFPSDLDNTTAAAFADVDGDRKLDLIVGNTATYLGPPSQNRLYRGDGRGGFVDVTATSLPTDRTAAEDIAVGDLDGDGDVDFVVANAAGSPAFGTFAVHVYLNGGRGVFTEAASPAMAVAAHAVELVDVDGDARLDLLLGRPTVRGPNGGLRLFLGDGRGSFQAGGSGFADPLASTVAVAVGDVDRNGIADFVTGNQWGRNRLFLGQGNLQWLDVTEPVRFGLPPKTLRWSQFELVDVDGDGDSDLIEGDSPLRLSLNDGDWRYRDVTATHLPALVGRTRGFLVTDVDGDRKPDIIVGTQVQATYDLRLLRGVGDGRFQAAPRADLPFTKILLGIQAGDLDGNGTVDLVVGSYGGPFLFRGDRNGKFAPDTRSTFRTADGLNPLRLGDVDGDGDLDIVTKTHNHLPTDEFQVYANDGKGVFTYLRSIAIPLSDLTEFHLLDIDGDRDLDLAIANRTPYLFLNDGTGNFTRSSGPFLPATGQSHQYHRFADWDHDGDPDVLVATRHVLSASALRYFENNRGTFVDRSLEKLGQRELRFPVLIQMRATDADQDGDPDFVFMHETGKQVLSNLHRQTHLSLALRLGRSHSVDVWSQPGSSVVQFALVQLAAGRGSYSIPPFGRLQLDLASLVLLPLVAIPAPSGHLALSLPVPNDPRLLGFRLYAQSLVIGPATTPVSEWRYTNLAIAPPVGR